MKTLYESILDDEDVLVKDTKEYSNNPFLIIRALLDECNCNLKQVRNKREHIEHVLKPVKDQFMKYSKIKKNGLYFDIDSSNMSNVDCSLKFYTFHNGERMTLFTFVYILQSKDEIFCFKNSIADNSGYSTVLNGASKFLIDKYNFKQKYLKDALVLEL